MTKAVNEFLLLLIFQYYLCEKRLALGRAGRQKKPHSMIYESYVAGAGVFKQGQPKSTMIHDGVVQLFSIEKLCLPTDRQTVGPRGSTASHNVTRTTRKSASTLKRDGGIGF